MADGMLRSPTFLVGAERQRRNLDEFQRREQQLAEAYHKNKPLCFNGCSYQKTHPVKAQKGHKDADACLTVPLVLGVADGVSQIEEFGIDSSVLPNELLRVVQQLGMHQLVPGVSLNTADCYRGPVSMMRRAFQATEALGSLTVVLAIMDNSTRIHGKLHPMIAIITIGDCELLVLRRVKGARAPYELVCHTEMQRIDGHAQTPLQLARVDERIDPNFTEELTVEVIERGSAVHCVSAYEKDLVIMGSDGVFDNLYLDEILELANNMLSPHAAHVGPTPVAALHALAQRIVELCHAKTRTMPNGQLPDAPIGRGGKKDDTSCVVAEVVEWTPEMQRRWAPKPSVQLPGWLTSMNFGNQLLSLDSCCQANVESDDEELSEVPNLDPRGMESNPVQLPPPAHPQQGQLRHMPPPHMANMPGGGANMVAQQMQMKQVQQTPFQPMSMHPQAGLHAPPGSIHSFQWTPSCQNQMYSMGNAIGAVPGFAPPPMSAPAGVFGPY